MAMAEMSVEFPDLSNTSQVSLHFIMCTRSAYAKFHCIALKSSLCLVLVSLERTFTPDSISYCDCRMWNKRCILPLSFVEGFLHLSVVGMPL